MIRLAIAGLLVAFLAPAVRAAPPPPCSSPLALALLARTGSPELQLAQRVIDREWTTERDSSYRPPIVGGVSEPGAMLLSAALPGAGQLYAGERSGYFYALAEAVGWAGWLLMRRQSDDHRDEASALAGVPADSASAWSFERWEDATDGDAGDLMALYAVDREAFYDAIADDERYAAGWSDASRRDDFDGLREKSDRRLRDARRAEIGLWINHLVSAVDALRAARFHNLPLSRGVELKAQGRWRRGPQIALALERRF